MKLTQLFFDFKASLRRGEAPMQPQPQPPPSPSPRVADLAAVESRNGPASPAVDKGDPQEDARLTGQCAALLRQLGLEGVARLVKVMWNPRLRSTAGYARFPAWEIELNPRLHEFEGQVDRTMKHELAHLIAYHRAGRRRIEPHGAEWQIACADLGIPDENARHQLPLPRREVRRNYTYACPSCQIIVRRVRKFRRFTACSACCRKHNGGQYDGRFRFTLIEPAAEH